MGDIIYNRIINTWREIKDIIPIKSKSYVIDFAINLKNNKSYVIELNPYGNYDGMGTSTAMFDIKKDHAILFAPVNDDKTNDISNTFEFRLEVTKLKDINLFQI